jgi:hypothetical protein
MFMKSTRQKEKVEGELVRVSSCQEVRGMRGKEIKGL